MEATRPEREAESKKIADEERKAAAEKAMALDQAASASRARRVLVECPGCGQVMELMKLPRHQKEECENRKVSFIYTNILHFLNMISLFLNLNIKHFQSTHHHLRSLVRTLSLVVLVWCV